MNVSISICPTSLQFDNGDTYDEQKLLEAIREFVTQRHPDARITTLQVGHRQGDAWARVDGDDEAGDDLIGAFWEARGSDEDLFVEEPRPVFIEAAVADETIRECAGLTDYGGLDHSEMPQACAAYRTAALAALDADPRAGRLTVIAPRGQRMLHSQWCGAHFSYTAGALATMGDLTEAEKAAVSAADDAGREAAREVISAADDEALAAAGLVCDRTVEEDASGGQGHCWRIVRADELPANILAEIEAEMTAGGTASTDDYMASNGCHYRW